MKRALKIAGFGLLTGAAVTLAIPSAALARDGGSRMGDFGGFGRGPVAAMTFADLDTNGDGSITEEDFTARAETRFSDMDADGNGGVTPEELAASMVARMNERLAEEDDNANTPSETQLAARAERMAERVMLRADLDNNGTLEADELAPRMDAGRLIDRFDTDDDNAWSEAEFDEMKAEREQRMERRGHSRDRDERGGHGDWRGERGHGERGGRW